MSNARNLSDLLGTGSTIATSGIADDAITSAKIADDAVVAAAIATNAVASDALNIVAADLPTDTGIIQHLRDTDTGPSSWSVTANNWYNFDVSISITPTAADNFIVAFAETYVPAEGANNGNNNQYKTLYGSRSITHCSDSWNYSDPATDDNKAISRSGIAIWKVLSGEVGTAQTVRPQWSPDGGGTYTSANYLSSGKVSATLVVMEIRG